MKRRHVDPEADSINSHGYDTARMESLLPRTGDYSTWSKSELRSEIARRGLAHGVDFSGVFSDDAARKARLVEILNGNDALSSELKKIAARYTGDDKETKP